MGGHGLPELLSLAERTAQVQGSLASIQGDDGDGADGALVHEVAGNC